MCFDRQGVFKFVFVLITDLVELVLLAELNALFPAVVALEQVGCDPPELDQLMLLQALGQRDVVKVVIGVDGGAQSLEIRQKGGIRTGRDMFRFQDTESCR